MILIIGGNGSIGTRYQAIFKKYNIEYKVFDDPSQENDHEIGGIGFDKAIICTPTRTHFTYCKMLMDLQKPFLCEKPMSMDMNECDILINNMNSKYGSMVNNWSLALLTGRMGRIKKISYQYYHTGSDGLVWDVCQLVDIASQLGAKLEVSRSFPVFNCTVQMIDGTIEQISLEEIQRSYIQMLINFVDGTPSINGTLFDGMMMTKNCLRLLDLKEREGHGANEDFLWAASENKLYPITWKDLQTA